MWYCSSLVGERGKSTSKRASEHSETDDKETNSLYMQCLSIFINSILYQVCVFDTDDDEVASGDILEWISTEHVFVLVYLVRTLMVHVKLDVETVVVVVCRCALCIHFCLGQVRKQHLMPPEL